MTRTYTAPGGSYSRLYADMATRPHLLIAGACHGQIASSKSVGVMMSTLTRGELCILADACTSCQVREMDSGKDGRVWYRLHDVIMAEIIAADAAEDAAQPDTNDEEQNEEETPMSTTERYDYMEHMTADVIDAIRETYTDDEIRARLDDDRDEFAQTLNDDLWTDDSVTGNASGSYYCNAWRAEEAIAHNWDLIADMIDEFDDADILRKGPESIDVSIRCYLLGQAIDAALDQLDEEIPEAEEIDDDSDDADGILA